MHVLAVETETIAQRVANEIESWANFPSGIAVVFYESAAKEIEHRIKRENKRTLKPIPIFIKEHLRAYPQEYC